jgi:glycylpeptide N-tetradecanoyltransferase
MSKKSRIMQTKKADKPADKPVDNQLVTTNQPIAVVDQPAAVADQQSVTERPSTYWKNKPIKITKHFGSHELESLTDRQLYNSEERVKLPYPLTWSDCDRQSVCDFLNKYNNTPFEYTVEHLDWLLDVNGFIVCMTVNNVICGVTCVTVRHMTMFDKTVNMGQVVYLCAHPKYRGKKIVNVLLDETIRMCCTRNIEHGYFFTDREINEPRLSMNLYIRPINHEKLIDNNILELSGDENFALSTDMPDNCQRALGTQYSDIYILYCKAMNTYNVCINYDYDEFIRMISNDMITTYVITDNNNKIVDYIILYNRKYRGCDVVASVLLSYSCNTESVEMIMRYVLKIASLNGYDMVHITDMMQNAIALSTNDNDTQNNEDRLYENCFIRDRRYHLNLFNWSCPKLKCMQVHLPLII